MQKRGWRARAGVAIAVGVVLGAGLSPGVAGAATEPGRPTGVYAVAGDGEATVGWVAPADDGGSPITGYTVTASPGGLQCTTDSPIVTACMVYNLDFGTAHTFTVTAHNGVGTSLASSASNSVVPVEGAGAFVPLPAPRRIADTRPGFTTDDGRHQGEGALDGGDTLQVAVAGRVGLAADVEHAVLSVVAVAPATGGYLTVWSCDDPMPSTSSMNVTKGVTLAGTVLTRLGTDDGNQGDVCIYSTTATHLIVDLPGSLSPTAFSPLPSPARIADSRPGSSTDDGLQQGFGVLDPGEVVQVQVGGRLGVPSEAANAVLSVVAIGPAGVGYLTVYPCGGTRPATSSMNFSKGVTLATTVLTKLGGGGKACVYTSTRTHLLVDLTGSFTPVSYQALPTPKRIADSRATGDTDDDQYRRFGALTPGVPTEIAVAGRVGLAANVRKVVLSVVAVGPPSAGYFTIYPCGARPATSSMNFTKAVTLASTVITKLSASGTVCVYSSARTHVVIDVSGALG